MTTAVFIPVSVGELIDKLTILQIKMDRIRDPEKLVNIANEIKALNAAHDVATLTRHTDYDELFQEMMAINQTIWDLEDTMHELLAQVGTSDEAFGRISKQIHQHNDNRARQKLRINRAFNSAIIEEKSYEEIK